MTTDRWFSALVFLALPLSIITDMVAMAGDERRSQDRADTTRALDTASANLARTPFGPDVGPHQVAVLLFDWRDEKRDRTVPVKLYLPKTPLKTAPVVIFSHGLGGTRNAAAYLGRHWASYGYASIHVQHPGSDESVWRGSREPLQSLRAVTVKPGVAYDRLLDISFVIDQLARMNKEDGELRERFGLERVGMSGHSFGAITTQGIAGMSRTVLGRSIRYEEPRVKAGFAMSPSPPTSIGDDPRRLDEAFGSIRIPMLYMTGTRDDGVAITDITPQQRLLPFAHTKSVDCFQLVIDEGDHGIFADTRPLGGRLRASRGLDIEAAHAVIRTISTAFWAAYLRDDATARSWLTSEQCRQWIGRVGDWQWRQAATGGAKAGKTRSSKQ